jgi:prepilin-type N-terminal cleavage/methylation domain-containing protein
MKNKQKGFSLMEVLVVVGIVAVLAGAVVYLLNPGQLFKQGNDANRVAGISTLDKSISLYYSDAINNPSTLFMGTSSVVYISIPDPTATTTAGTNCAGIGLTSTASTTYHCAASSTYLKVDGTGWIPINFGYYPGGSPLSSLPKDPVNTTSSGEYYVYTTDGMGGYELMANPQSIKDASDTADFVRGTSIALLPSFPTGGSGGGGVITFTASTYAVGSYPYAIAFDSNTKTIWVANGNRNVTQINDTAPYASSTYAAGSNPLAIAFDSNTKTIWVANDAYLNYAVTQISDTAPYTSSTYAAGSNPLAIAFDSNTKTIWVANSGNGTVTQISDATPYTSSTYTVGSGPNGIAFDSHTNTIWVTNGGDGTVTQINDTTPYASSTYAVGSNPDAIAFDSHTNTIWVANGGDGTVTQINDTTPYASSTYVAVAPSPDSIFGIATAYAGKEAEPSPSAIAFDSHTNSIWAANEGSNTVTQINDTAPYASSTYAVGSGPAAVAFDSNTNSIWVANSSDNTITLFTPSR